MSTVLYWAGMGLFVAFFFSLCIFVHELGHLLAALWRGLVVEKFSVGFGKRLWGFRRHGVDYQVSMIPFGGYVALPQLDPSEHPTASDGRPLPHAKPLDRIIAALAGPLFNILFGFLLGFVVWWAGVYKPAKATWCDVYKVPAEAPEYVAGLRPDDRITRVNGQSFTGGWPEVTERIVLTTGEVTLTVRRGAEVKEFSYRPKANPDTEGLGYPFFKVRSPTVLRTVLPNSAAAAAGLKPGDQIVSVNGEAVEDTQDFIARIRASAGQPMRLLVERQGQRLPVNGVQARSEQVAGQAIYRIGAEIDAPWVLTHPTPVDQLCEVWQKTRDTLKSLFSRDSLVKPRHMSGPIGIVQVIAVKVSHGVRDGLAFIVFVSFSLALLNLLPIPVLDGGHILLAVVEWVIRRPVPVRVAYLLQNAFAILLIGFMLYVTFFDLRRSGKIWKMIRPEPAAEAPAKAAPPAAPAKAPVPAPGPAPAK